MMGPLEAEVRELIVSELPEAQRHYGFDALLDPVSTFGLGTSGNAMKVARYALRLAIGTAKATALLASGLEEEGWVKEEAAAGGRDGSRPSHLTRT